MKTWLKSPKMAQNSYFWPHLAIFLEFVLTIFSKLFRRPKIEILHIVVNFSEEVGENGQKQPFLATQLQNIT